MRLYIVLAIAENRLHFWTGKTWLEFRASNSARIRMWKEQGEREAATARRFLPPHIPTNAVFFAQVFRPEPPQPTPSRSA